MAPTSRESDVRSQSRYLNSSLFFPFPFSLAPCPMPHQCLDMSEAGFPQALVEVDVKRRAETGGLLGRLSLCPHNGGRRRPSGGGRCDVMQAVPW